MHEGDLPALSWATFRPTTADRPGILLSKLAGPMQLRWLPNSQNGLMVGDYIATAFTNGVPHGVFAVAAAKAGTSSTRQCIPLRD